MRTPADSAALFLAYVAETAAAGTDVALILEIGSLPVGAFKGGTAARTAGLGIPPRAAFWGPGSALGTGGLRRRTTGLRSCRRPGPRRRPPGRAHRATGTPVRGSRARYRDTPRRGYPRRAVQCRDARRSRGIVRGLGVASPGRPQHRVHRNRHRQPHCARCGTCTAVQDASRQRELSLDSDTAKPGVHPPDHGSEHQHGDRPLAFSTAGCSDDRVDCVDVAGLPADAALRDSKHPAAGHLSFPAAGP